MKRNAVILSSRFFSFVVVAMFAAQSHGQTQPVSNTEPNKSAPIPMDQLGVVAGKQYHGDGLSVNATPDGARLHCAFQRLEGHVTREGLWLSSTADNAASERFRVMAVEVGRADGYGVRRQSAAPPPLLEGDWMEAALPEFQSGVATSFPPQSMTLPVKGTVSVKDQTARFIRDGLTEEYSVSVDGVRQDFIVDHRPGGEGELRVELDVTGAKAEPLVNGVRLVLDGSGRKLAYNRLRVVDATGRELPARMAVAAGVSPAVEGGILPPGGIARTTEASGFHCDPFASSGISAGLPVLRSGSATEDGEATTLRQAETPAATRLAVLVDDAAAIYPVRIDPTFSDADWISMGGIPGADGFVYASAVDALGNFYIGGNFTNVGNGPANCISKWDGSNWSALGSGINGGVYALAVSGSNVYAGGQFTTAGGTGAANIAKWNGSSWSSVSSGISGVVGVLAVLGGDLYAGGHFTTAGGIGATNIAKWNGSSWSSLSSGMNDAVNALAVSGSNVYAGGVFTTAGGIAANYIARWDGNVWSVLGAGMNNLVTTLAVSGSNVYAGGVFTTAGSSVANYIAKWNGSSWSALGLGMNDVVNALAVSGSDVYAGGRFRTAGGIAANYIARWDGNVWSVLGAGMNNLVLTLAASGTNIYAGGYFSLAGGNGTKSVGKWDGTSWSSLGPGMNGNVSATVVTPTNLYVGGSFIRAGEVDANHIAKWDGDNWSTLGSGMNSNVSALVVSGSDLYAGGSFTTAGGIVVNRIAKWDGANWSALGLGMNDFVADLALSETNLYVGGRFTRATNVNNVPVTVNGIANWNGNTWSPVGVGMSGTVSAVAISSNNLYVGGILTNSALSSRSINIAKWDGATWSNLGATTNRLDASVSALMTSGTNLYAGGSFQYAGNQNVNFIAKWDGSTWSALGSGMNGSVFCLAMAGTDLYAGGLFTTAGGVAANHIAKWDGSSWSALASGVEVGQSIDNASVNSISAYGKYIYVGGRFSLAGNKMSGSIAKANIGAACGRFSDLVYSPVTGFSCTFLDGSVGQPYRIQTSSSLAAGPWTDFTNFTYSVPVVITVPAAAATNQFFRAITP